MYCPQCGQQQVAAELRFCSRCGFPLGGVTELLSTGGVIPQYQPPAADTQPKISPRRKGVQQGVALIFLAAVLAPLFAALNEFTGFPELFAVMVAIIGFIGGPLRIIYATILEEGAPKKVYMTPHQQPVMPAFQPPQRDSGDMSMGRALPPQQSVPPPQWRRPDTSELMNRPSVTENTTKLLDKQEEPPAD